MVSVSLASEKFDSSLELDAWTHKTERATRDMMGNVGAPFSFHHKRILNLAVVSRFIGNAKLTAAMISFFRASTTPAIEFWDPLGRIGFKVGWEKQKHKKMTKKTEDSWEPRDTLGHPM